MSRSSFVMKELMSATTILEDLHRCTAEVRRERLSQLAEDPVPEHIDVLVASLRDENPGVQQAAVNHLVRIGDDAVVRRLLALLRDTPSVRNMAVEILDQIVGNGLEPALRVLESPDPNIRKFVVDMFARQSDQRVIEPLLRSLTDPDSNVRAAAAEALGVLQAHHAIPAIGRLLQDEEWVAFSAITALKNLGDSTALPLLVPLLEQGTPMICYAAVGAIGVLDRTGACLERLMRLSETASPELGSAIVESVVAITECAPSDLWSRVNQQRWLPMLEAALHDPDDTISLAAVKGFGRLKHPAGATLILEWCRTISPTEPNVIEVVVSALADLGDSESMIRLLTGGERCEPLVSIVVQALGRMKCRQAVHALIGVRVGHVNWDIRRLAVVALAEIGTPDAVEGIRHAVDDATGYVRCEAIRRLGAFKRPADMQWFLHRLHEERYEDVRDLLIAMLAESTSEDVIAAIPGLLQDAKPELRAAGARLVGLLAYDGGLELLLRVCNDSEWTVRQRIMEALGRYRDRRVEHELLFGLSDDHEKVRLAAVSSLAEQNTPEAWRALIALGLRDPDIWVRYRLIERFGSSQVREAFVPLTRIAESPEEPDLIRRAAAEAVQRIVAGDGRPEGGF
ncbi:MAG: HEAT repeat domain-containing protein [Nitrospira sp.]|nr:HEAT repeat domain-containing protein [Nitrospira sp.]